MLDFLFWGIMGATTSCFYSILRILFVEQNKEVLFSVNINRIIAGFLIGQSLFILLLSKYEDKSYFLFEIIIFLLFILYFILIFIDDFKIDRISTYKTIENILLIFIIGGILLKSVQYLLS